MRRRLPALVTLVLLAAACSSTPAAAPATSNPATPGPAHASPPTHSPAARSPGPVQPSTVVLVIMENSPYSTIAGNNALPFINGTIAANTINLTNMSADSSPSLPNYVWMAAGQSCGADGSDTAFDRTCPSVYDQLNKHGIGWTVYAEGYPGGSSQCFTGVSSDTASNDYARKHVPPLLFTTTSSGKACTDHMRNFPGDTPADGAPPANNFAGVKLAPFTVVVPNLCHDMHNSTAQCGSAGGGQTAGDKWLALNWPSLLRDAGPNGTVILTWDEGETSGEHIATYVGGIGIGQRWAGKHDGTAYDHASTLRAIQDAFRLPCLAGSCQATPLPIMIPNG